MRRLLALITLNVCFLLPVSGEEYVNEAYGLNIESTPNWQFSRTAKLQVDLHHLSNAQLKELFQAYQGWGTVRMRMSNGSEKNYPWLEIRQSIPQGKMLSALGTAQAVQEGAEKLRRSVLVPAVEKEFAGLQAAYLCTQLRTGTHHKIFIARHRSYVTIRFVVPQADEILEFDELIKQLPNIDIDVDVDSSFEN